MYRGNVTRVLWDNDPRPLLYKNQSLSPAASVSYTQEARTPPPYTTATLKAIPRRCSTRIINHPTTPPIAQMSKVIRLMGIGGERNRFVRISSTTPTSVLTARPTNETPPRARRAKSTTTTNMSMSNSIKPYLTLYTHSLIQKAQCPTPSAQPCLRSYLH